jgi:hypothetical protein
MVSGLVISPLDQDVIASGLASAMRIALKFEGFLDGSL